MFHLRQVKSKLVTFVNTLHSKNQKGLIDKVICFFGNNSILLRELLNIAIISKVDSRNLYERRETSFDKVCEILQSYKN